MGKSLLCRAAFGLFIAMWYGISYYFLLNPQKIHPLKNKLVIKKQTKHFLIAHRGGSMEAPENTMQAFMHSVNIGVDMIETDVRMTNDSRILVGHDDIFDRLCTPESLKKPNQTIRETSSEDLPTFKEDLPLHFSKGEFYHRNATDQSTYTDLEEVFQKLPKEQVIQIDVKDTDLLIAGQIVIKLIQKYNREKTTIIGTLNQENLDSLRKQDPSIPTFPTYMEGLKMTVYYLFGLLPYVDIPFDVLPAPYVTQLFINQKQKDVDEGKISYFSKYVQIVMISFSNYISNPIMVHLNKRGVVTNYWVLNEDYEIREALETTTIAGIMTDKPMMAKSILKEFDQKQTS